MNVELLNKYEVIKKLLNENWKNYWIKTELKQQIKQEWC